jgi:hypothetical protein
MHFIIVLTCNKSGLCRKGYSPCFNAITAWNAKCQAASHESIGVAGALLMRILSLVKFRAYESVHLETGVQEDFTAASALIARYGFVLSDSVERYEIVAAEPSINL